MTSPTNDALRRTLLEGSYLLCELDSGRVITSPKRRLRAQSAMVRRLVKTWNGARSLSKNITK